MRTPQQARSRERVERILAAALELMASTGVEGVRMTEVAERAGIPIGSVYQYFPDKVAIVRTLAQRLTLTVAEHVESVYAAVESSADYVAKTDSLIAWFYEATLAEPGSRDIQLAMQTDVELQKLDLEDTRRLAASADFAGHEFVSRDKRTEFATLCLLIVHSTAAVVRLAVVLPKREGSALVEEHRRMIRLRLTEVLDLRAGR